MAEDRVTERRQYIAKRLREERPNRYYSLSEFEDQVIDSIPDDLYDHEELLRFAKRKETQEQERSARARANRLIRDFQLSGQLELHWWITANEPLAIEHVTVDDEGKRKLVREYVALRAATSVDFRLWAENEEVSAQEDYEARMATVDGARAIADAIEAGNFTNFNAWATQTQPVEEDRAA